MRIGEMLVEHGLIDNKQLNEALNIQKNGSNKKIGEILIEQQFISLEDFEKILHAQIQELNI